MYLSIYLLFGYLICFFGYDVDVPPPKCNSVTPSFSETIGTSELQVGLKPKMASFPRG